MSEWVVTMCEMFASQKTSYLSIVCHLDLGVRAKVRATCVRVLFEGQWWVQVWRCHDICARTRLRYDISRYSRESVIDTNDIWSERGISHAGSTSTGLRTTVPPLLASVSRLRLETCRDARFIVSWLRRF